MGKKDEEWGDRNGNGNGVVQKRWNRSEHLGKGKTSTTPPPNPPFIFPADFYITYSCTRELTFERIAVIQDTFYRQCQKTQHRPFSRISSITLRSRISPCSSSGTNPLFLPLRYSTISLRPLFLGMSKSPNAKESEPYGSALAHQVVQFKTEFGKREND